MRLVLSLKLTFRRSQEDSSEVLSVQSFTAISENVVISHEYHYVDIYIYLLTFLYVITFPDREEIKPRMCESTSFGTG